MSSLLCCHTALHDCCNQHIIHICTVPRVADSTLCRIMQVASAFASAAAAAAASAAVCCVLLLLL
jgi:hypothetical protein